MAPVGGVVDISSDEEDFLISDALGSIDPAGWTADLFDVDDDATGEDFDDLMVMSEISAPPVLQQTAKPDDLVFMSELSKPALQKKANADGGCDEDDDDCVVLDGDPDKAVTVADEEGSAGDGSSDELQIVAEKGPIACRDFPHSRHLCSNLPFSTTSHAKHCVMCHCFVCDAPAPCKYWGNSTSSNDHCHATDKEPKWKLMRQVFRSTQLPASAPEKLPNDLYSARHFAAPQLPPSSVLHAGHPPLAIQSPLLNEGSQNQQRHHSVRVSLSVGGTVSSPRAGRGTCNAHITQNTHSRAIFKRAGAVSPGFASKNASQFGAACPDNSLMDQALPHVSQAAHVAPTTNAFTGTAQNNPFQRSFSAPTAYQVQQVQPAAYYQVATNGMDVIEPQLSRCTSLITERTPCLPEPVTDVGTKSWEDILATVASDLGVADYDISTTESPHVMTDSQPVHSPANQGFGLQHESVAAMENLMSSHMHDLSSHTTVSNVQANSPLEITENWGISGSSPVPNEARLNDFASAPADVLSVEAATHQLEVSRLESADILFEFDWS
ncbi:hypothetical protein SEVIR_9G228700v4 [Setaria viridis]|uniref:RPM1 interacting protein 13 n=1 Tax=Setaria viridis TaxID=4556 RepID=A0A4U6SWU4_SETVI|nr:uncharacterized protein LOC117840864 [Setaria viridis]TKV93487.1 hypothetical protein SEVIR_9G228700v2 [Setaria viridis]